MILDLNDRQSPAWVKLKVHLLERLQDHRVKNDGNLTEAETAKLRGRIAEDLYILSLGEEKTVIKHFSEPALGTPKY